MGFSLVSILGGSQQGFPGAFCEDTLLVGTIKTNQNDFAPNGGGGPLSYVNASVWDITPQADITITGMKGGVAGRRVTIVNSGDFGITLAQDDAGSDELNRFNFSLTIQSATSAVIQWSRTIQRWVLVSQGSTAPNAINGATQIAFDGMTELDYGGASIQAGNGDAGAKTGGTIGMFAGASTDGFGGNINIATGQSDAGDELIGTLNIQFGNNVWLTGSFANGVVLAAGIKLGFFGAAAVDKQSITGATTQLQVDSIVAALVALGLVSDDR